MFSAATNRTMPLSTQSTKFNLTILLNLQRISTKFPHIPAESRAWRGYGSVRFFVQIFVKAIPIDEE